jgi:hypothetical protein
LGKAQIKRETVFMIRRYILSAGTAAAMIIAFMTGGVAHAQSPSTNSSVGNGMRVAPVRSDLTIEPGKSQTVDIYVQNVTGSTAKIKGIVNDFVASDDESGKPRILLDEGSEAPSHGLKKYVENVPTFELKANEQKIIKVKVTFPADAAGGGYYGAIRFLPEGVDDSKNLSLSASVGSLILVRVPGDVKEQADVSSFNVSRGDGKASNMFTNGSNLKATVRINNTGNIKVSPFGKVQLKKGNKVVGSYEINATEPRGSVLPDSIRRFSVDFGDNAKTLGKYTVEGNFGYGSTGQLVSAKTSFFVVPLPILITIIVCILLIIAAVVVGPRLLKSHDRKLLRKVRRNK